MFESKDILKAVENGDLKTIKEFIKSGGNIYKEYIKQEFYKMPETLISRAVNYKQIEIFEVLLEEYENDYKIAEMKVVNHENQDFLMKYIFIAFEDDIQEVLKLPKTESSKNCNLVLLAERKVCVLAPIVANKSLLYKLSKNGFVNINSRSIVGDNGLEQISRLDLLKRTIKIGLNLKESHQHLQHSTEYVFLEGAFKSVECVQMIKYCLDQVHDLSSQDILILSAVNRNPQVFDVVLSHLTKNTSKSNEDFFQEFIADYDNVNFSIHCCHFENFDLLTHILKKYKINIIDHTEEDKAPFLKEYLKTEKSLKYLEEIIKFQYEKLDDILEAVTLDTNPEIVKFIWRNLKEEHFKKFEESIIIILKLVYEKTIGSNLLKFIEILDPNEIYNRYIRNTALFVAIEFDCEPIVSNLIKRGANLLHTNSLGETALTTACEFANPEILRIILKKEPSLLNVAGQHGLSPITKLVSREKINLEIFQKLIRKGAKIDVKCSRNNTLLHYAVLAGRTDFVQKLLEIGVDPSVQNNDGQTALYLSTKRENLDIFNLILKSGKIDIETKTSRDHTILYRACKSYTPDFFNSLMKMAKPNVHLVNTKGQTPLFWCHDVARCETLLKLGTDPKIVDENNFPFYTIAALDCNEKIVEFCLQKSDLDLTIVGNNGRTLLHSTCGMNLEIEKYIGNENVKDIFRKCSNEISNYETPFHNAADYHNLTLMKLMFEYAEPNLENKNEKGETPIFGNLRHSCDLNVLNYLIEKGANVNAQNNEGNTIIFESIFPRGTEILLRNGAAVNIRNSKGQTALHYAAKRDDLDTILLLIKYGAELNLKDENDMRPVDYCKRSYVREFLEFIESSLI